MGSSQAYSINESADFWRYDIGVSVIPADTVNKKPLVTWSEWQDKPIPEDIHYQWKQQAAFSEGIAIMPGKVWHNEHKRHLYFTFIDADTQKAIDELCSISDKISSVQELSKKFLVEQHKDNPQKAHVYFYSPIPFPKKNADSVLGLEVKGLGEPEHKFRYTKSCCFLYTNVLVAIRIIIVTILNN